MQRLYRPGRALAVSGLLSMLLAQGGNLSASSPSSTAQTLRPVATSIATVVDIPTVDLSPATRVAPPVSPAPAPPPPASNSGVSPSPDAVALTNRQRQAAGLATLSTNSALTNAAAQHSADQARHNSMGHTGSDGSNAGARISANGGSFSTWAENVAAGYGRAGGVVDGWMNSSGHRQNILNPSMTQIGVAVAIAADGTPYWTMVLSG